MTPSMTLCYDIRDRNLDYDLLRKLISQWREINSYYYADYYPLTSHSMAKDVWMAWQFNQPETGEGVVQAFRRPANRGFGYEFQLRGLKPDSLYEITDLDSYNFV